jgi:hypothetical protein
MDNVVTRSHLATTETATEPLYSQAPPDTDPDYRGKLMRGWRHGPRSSASVWAAVMSSSTIAVHTAAATSCTPP